MVMIKTDVEGAKSAGLMLYQGAVVVAPEHYADMLARLREARSELSNFTRNDMGDRNEVAIDIVESIDAILARIDGGQP
jgi:hypothetical protein